MPTKKPLAQPLSDAALEAGMKFAMDTMGRMPKENPEVLEAHITGMLVVYWGALWGTMGTGYARDFIEAQLRGMEPDEPHEVFIQSRVQ